jgi:hypothetical protein
VIEKVGGYIQASKDGQAGGAQPGSAAFKFGASYGALKAFLVAGSVPFEEITPAVWQRGVGLTPRAKGETKTAWKNRIKAHTQQLFPGRKITLAVADAILLAEYARRKMSGILRTAGRKQLTSGSSPQKPVG